MVKKYSRLLELARYLVLLLAAIGFMALCSLSTTPFLKYSYGQDAAFFSLVGQGMHRGLLPYRDFFDMKGPYLFFLQYLGQMLVWGRVGPFPVQCICFFVTLIFADKILCMCHPTGRISVFYSLILMVPAAVVMCYTMTGGNLTEELSLPFLMASLYFGLGYLKRAEIPSRENQDHPLPIGFFYGAVFGIMCMIRITNAALVGAIILTITVNLIREVRWKNLLLNGLCFVAGAAVAVAPACIWAYANGILGEMLNQVFLFGGKYAGETGMLEKFLGLGKTVWPCIFSLLLPLIVLCVYRVKNWRYWLLFVSAFAVLMVAVTMGNAYCHYFVLGIPLAILASGFFVQYSTTAALTPGSKCLRILLVLLLVAASFGVQSKLIYRRGIAEINYGFYCMRTHDEDSGQYDAIQEIVSQIPDAERNSVYVYGMSSCSNWYLQANLLPPNKYCDWQEHYIELVPEIGGELESFLRDDARWVVVERGRHQEPEQIRNVLESNFAVAFENEYYSLLGRA